VDPVTTLRGIFKEPDLCTDRILKERRIFGLRTIRVAGADKRMVVLHLSIKPWPAMALEKYPVEDATLVLVADGRVFALPSDGARSWRHRMPAGLRELCLWYVDDPPDLQWSWRFGLEALITITHRHLMAEEYCRRHHRWPFGRAGTAARRSKGAPRKARRKTRPPCGGQAPTVEVPPYH
jgi:hypothetical protein